VLAECASGRELIARGDGGDVALAAQSDVSRVVPLLQDGILVAAP
jgi:phosphosulfolactate phosphohydrolase-like enzyme